MQDIFLAGHRSPVLLLHEARGNPLEIQLLKSVARRRRARIHADPCGYGNAGDASRYARRSTFGNARKAPAVSSAKAVHGHTLGAAGAMEPAITVLAPERGACPPTAHLEDTDAEGGDLIVGAARRGPVRTALSNALALGGSNVSLAVRQHQANDRDANPAR